MRFFIILIAMLVAAATSAPRFVRDTVDTSIRVIDDDNSTTPMDNEILGMTSENTTSEVSESGKDKPLIEHISDAPVTQTAVTEKPSGSVRVTGVTRNISEYILPEEDKPEYTVLELSKKKEAGPKKSSGQLSVITGIAAIATIVFAL
ncbi:unnamed protein product [Caenorhabditis bovis]|uniref:Uncharacterized protein n=1 Tax=Caenorhabditis bovis TaxID=2654633 RepID=A0A8S1E7W5_9PELO|nr:unnamed protein product [Caenorhabditis bovis]